MIISVVLLIFTVLIIIFSILDLKTRAIPSVLLTATIILLTFVRWANFRWALIFGLFGLLLYEFSEAEGIDFGIADIKVMIMLGFFIPNIFSMLALVGSFAVGQVFYIFIVNKFAKFKEVPFIPFLLALWIGGLIGGIFV